MTSKIIALVGMLTLMNVAAFGDVISDLRPAINEAATKHDVNPVLMEAIMRHESANGKSNAACKYNNLAGIMAKNGLRRFETKEECVEKLAVILRAYHDRGLTSLSSISGRYAPYHRTSWTSKVGIFTRQIEAGKWGALSAS